MKKLTAIQIAKIKKPGRYSVGDGAYLQITGQNGRSWIFRYERDGRARHIGLGSCRYISLAEAREKAHAMRRSLILDGLDPFEAKRRAARERLLASATAKTFREVALDYIAAHEDSWRGDHSRKQWTSSLEKYVFPRIGAMLVAAVDITGVLAVLDAMKSVPETAARVKNRIALILDWAAARDLRSHDNPAKRSNLLPKRKKRQEHFAALPYQDVGAFMRELRQRPELGARALELQILTAVRPGETLGARWDEISGDTWTIPAERTKAHREHRVPLSRPAVKLLAALPRTSPMIFGQPSPQFLARVLKRMNVDDATPHGFRSCFRDWAAETTAYPNFVVEQALAHSIGSVEAAYRRGDLFEKRRRLMAQWSDYCDRPPRVTVDVTPLHRTSA
jgi:integrase